MVLLDNKFTVGCCWLRELYMYLYVVLRAKILQQFSCARSSSQWEPQSQVKNCILPLSLFNETSRDLFMRLRERLLQWALSPTCLCKIQRTAVRLQTTPDFTPDIWSDLDLSPRGTRDHTPPYPATRMSECCVWWWRGLTTYSLLTTRHNTYGSMWLRTHRRAKYICTHNEVLK